MTTTSIDLRPYNSFGIFSTCDQFRRIYNDKDIYELLVDGITDFRILGGGSNVLLPGHLSGLVVRNEIKGIEIIDEDESLALVQVGAGESWHFFVQWAISHKLGGLENLALIPGTVGAAPIQNIGAYGIEQSQCFHSLKAISLEDGINKAFYKSDCAFGYRDSYFKREGLGKFFITQVRYLLHKNSKPNIQYEDVQKHLQEKNISEPTIEDVFEAITEIRTRKLPNPKHIGNAGSFFKNPVISAVDFQLLKAKFPEIKSYPTENGAYKLAAAWLIDQCGFKGIKVGNTGCYHNQALVIVNHGGATGQEIKAFAHQIMDRVAEVFGVQLEPEVNIW